MRKQLNLLLMVVRDFGEVDRRVNRCSKLNIEAKNERLKVLRQNVDFEL